MAGFLSFEWITTQFLFLLSFGVGNFAVWLAILLFWRASKISRGKEIDRTNYILWLITSCGSLMLVLLIARFFYRLLVN